MAEAGGGSAPAQAELWGARARDWGEVMEGPTGWGIPVYRHVHARVGVGPGVSLLDVGCGAGRSCRMAADLGATVAGLDATRELLEIARGRTPGGDFRLGDMEDLPWPDGAFDVVTGFNSFFIAADMVAALREARRVARPGGRVAMTVFGRPERCGSTAMFRAVARLLAGPPAGGGAPAGPALHEEGVLEARTAEAGLALEEAGYLDFVETYPDLATLLRGVMAAAPMVRAARAVGGDAVGETLTEAFRPFRTPSGAYALEEEVRYLVARA
jgi:SAM-dependent methyltransferase